MNAWNSVIVRLGELTLKGRNRHRFERRVMEQLEPLLHQYPAIGVKTEFGRIHMVLNGAPYEAVEETLGHIFGLSSYSPAYRTELDLDAMKETAVELLQSHPPGRFKVSVKRANKSFPTDSQETAYWIGGYALEHSPGWKVDVHHPDVELGVDIRSEEAYLYDTVTPGTGGFPLGTNGLGMLMLSGGIDSPVAGWLAMRSGMEVEAVHFHSYPYTSERAKQKVIDLARTLSLYAGSLKLHLVPFTDIQVGLKDECRENLLVTCMKRAMLRITERLAEKHGARAIVTGESLGQVASQTLPSLDVIGRAVDLLIVRPLVVTDKTATIKLAEQIGTFPISIRPYEDCCTLFLPKSPSTNPSLRVVQQQEARMGWLEQAMNKAIDETETIRVRWQETDDMDAYF